MKDINVFNSFAEFLEEDSFGEKILKIRLSNRLDRVHFARLIGVHADSIKKWEKEGVLPKAENVMVVCELFGKELEDFGEYYKVYYEGVGERISKWKERKGCSNRELWELLGVSESAVKRLKNGKVGLSYEMYERLVDMGII